MQSGFHIGYPKCFWTDTYYSSYDEMQKLYKDNGVECVDHFAQDGLAPLFHNRVDQWSDEQFETWFKYHLSVCSEKSIINMSNHVIIVGRKKQIYIVHFLNKITYNSDWNILLLSTVTE